MQRAAAKLPRLDDAAVMAAGKLQLNSIGHLLKLAANWPEAAAAAMGLLAALLENEKPIPPMLRAYFVERLSAASREPDRVAHIFGLRGAKGRKEIDDLCRNLRVVEVVRQLHALGYVLRLDAVKGAFEAASEYLIRHGTPLSAPQVSRIWKGRKKYAV